MVEAANTQKIVALLGFCGAPDEEESIANARRIVALPGLEAERDKLKADLNDALEIGLRCSAKVELLEVANAELVDALESSIELIEVLDGKDNSCEPKSDIGDLRAVLAKHQKEASCG